MDPRINDFCTSVCSKVKHAAPWEKSNITKELSDHIVDHQEALMLKGFSKEDSLNKAVLAMGDPEEIGEELNKQYPLFWLIVSRIPLVLTIIFIYVLLIQYWCIPEGVIRFHNNIVARINPYYGIKQIEKHDDYYDIDLENFTKVNIRVDGPGNDIVRVLAYKICDASEYEFEDPFPREDYDSFAKVCICNYDKNLFGKSAFYLCDNTFFYSPYSLRGSFWFDNVAGPRYTYFYIPIEKGSDCIVFHSYYGSHFEIKIPFSVEGAM